MTLIKQNLDAMHMAAWLLQHDQLALSTPCDEESVMEQRHLSVGYKDLDSR